MTTAIACIVLALIVGAGVSRYVRGHRLPPLGSVWARESYERRNRR